MLKEKINKTFLELYKNKEFEKKSLLSLIKGEIDSFEKDKKKEMKDEEIIAILKIYIKNAKDSFNYTKKESYLEEAKFYETFLPELIEISIVEKEVKDLKEKGFNFWMIMKTLKEKYPWKLDLAKVSELAK